MQLTARKSTKSERRSERENEAERKRDKNRMQERKSVFAEKLHVAASVLQTNTSTHLYYRAAHSHFAGVLVGALNTRYISLPIET